MNSKQVRTGCIWLVAGIICGLLAAHFPERAPIVTVIMVVIAGWFVRALPLRERLLTAGSLLVGFGGILLLLR
ncbi:hypothetical protein TUM12370_14680 [Salmonella enterica subsp. enterica serovar Choleraesuis]|nr:hypothetical protein TUM12370_14680 [Salmonella enterica subsp. enterica serovar Choleraesuis]